MDCGLPGQPKVCAFCPVAFRSLGERAASSDGAGELEFAAPPALACVLTAALLFRSAQFEHTVLITSRGAQILTELPHEG